MTLRNHTLPPHRHSGLDPESSDGVSKGRNALQGNGRATWIPAFAGMTGKGAGMTKQRHSGLDPESSSAASKGSNALQGNGRATWIPAFAGMTGEKQRALKNPRHSGLDPESSDGVSIGRNALQGNDRATWIPAFAGMTGKGTGMTRTESMLKLLCASSITLASLLAMQPAHAAYPQVETLVNFTGNLPEGGNGAKPGFWEGLILSDTPTSPLVAGANGLLYGALQYGGGTEAMHEYGGTGRVFFSYDTNTRAFTPLLRADGFNSSWLQKLHWGSDGNLYSLGRHPTGATTNGLARYDAASQQWIALNAENIAVYGQAIEADNRFYFKSARRLVALNKDGSIASSDAITLPLAQPGRAKIYLRHSKTGRLYGMTSGGGGGFGVNIGFNAVISIDPANPSVLARTVHQFPTSGPGQGAATGIVGMLEDTTDAAGTVYVLSTGGGSRGVGALWRFHPDAGSEGSSHEMELLHSFSSSDQDDFAQGGRPTALVQGADGHIYGTTSTGGLSRQGVIFRYHKTEGYQRMYSFGPKTGPSTNPRPDTIDSHPEGVNADGMRPTKLIRSGDDLYGYTEYGGNVGWGTLFKFTPGDELPGGTTLNLAWQPELANLTVAQGYSREIVWSSWLTTNCQATTTDPTGETQWGGATAANGTKALTFNSIGTWTYTLKCDSTIADTEPLSKTINIEVVTAESQDQTVGNDGGGSFTPALALLSLLGGGWLLRRRRTVR